MSSPGYASHGRLAASVASIVSLFVSGGIKAPDALLVLKLSVKLPVVVKCPKPV